MKSAKLLLVFILTLVFSIQLFPQSKLKVRTKSPRFILGGTVGYNYVVGSANGEARKNFPLNRDEITGEYTFDPHNFGMQQGGGITVWGKHAINRKRTWYATGEIGFNLFYNTKDKGLNRTKWSLFDLGAGMEYKHRASPKNWVYVGLQLQYSLIFGGWQTDIVYPDNSISNIYVKIQPASRIGAALSSGMEFKAGKKSTFIVGVRGVWANILPKSSIYPLTAYSVGMTDSKGVVINNRKDIIYMQLFTGLNFTLR